MVLTDADDEDLAGILEVWVSEVARDVLLRAPGAYTAPLVSMSRSWLGGQRTEGSRNTDYDSVLGGEFLGQVDGICGRTLPEDVQVRDAVADLDQCSGCRVKGPWGPDGGGDAGAGR